MFLEKHVSDTKTTVKQLYLRDGYECETGARLTRSSQKAGVKQQTALESRADIFSEGEEEDEVFVHWTFAANSRCVFLLIPYTVYIIPYFCIFSSALPFCGFCVERSN